MRNIPWAVPGGVSASARSLAIACGARSALIPVLKLLMVKSPASSIRLLATDIDGTLLNPQFQISDRDLAALRQAHAAGIEIVLVTGRRHTFALPIAQQLGFDLWLISSNGAVTRSLVGETFHRELMR